ncbi:MAG: hypothetical protein M1817_001064 [Caeruleum heppii]|nr:MAG: hypothetical protein M1817_001064 [Caeruleum heppii]
MPLRERMRRVFGRNTSDDDLTPKRTRSQKAELYQVGEPMPKPKYPGRYNKPHQDMLKAFSFSDKFTRRASEQTDVSPMGSKMPSRKNSSTTAGRKSMGHHPSRVEEQLAENVCGDDDVHNVGLARQMTPDRNPTHARRDPELMTSAGFTTNGTHKPESRMPFTQKQLSTAVKNSSLHGPRMNGIT